MFLAWTGESWHFFCRNFPPGDRGTTRCTRTHQPAAPWVSSPRSRLVNRLMPDYMNDFGESRKRDFSYADTGPLGHIRNQ